MENYSRLTVIEKIGKNIRYEPIMLCKCSCGKTKEVIFTHLKSGSIRSCGCLRIEQLNAQSKKHGFAKRNSQSADYRIWKNINARCRDLKNKYYGGRGILVCKEWKNNFEIFLKDMGLRPSSLHSIDRINNNGNYEPSNCRWATKKEQANNRRR